MNVVSFPAKLVFFQIFILDVQNVRKIGTASSICVSCILNVYKFSIQKMLKSWILELHELAALCELNHGRCKIYYNVRKIRQVELEEGILKQRQLEQGKIEQERLEKEQTRAGATRARKNRARKTRAGSTWAGATRAGKTWPGKNRAKATSFFKLLAWFFFGFLLLVRQVIKFS